MIKLENVSVKKEGRAILRDLSLLLEPEKLPRRRIGIIGHNGSGKSSFIRLLNGIELPTTGIVEIDKLCTKANRKDVLRKVGFVFQNPDNQIIYPQVREDLAFGLKNRRLSKAEINERIDHIADQFNVTHLLDRLSHNLSGGEKQIMALIGALIMEPDYLVLDEPTTLLDLRNKRRVMEMLDSLKQTVIVVSHDLDFLRSYDHILRFEEGQLIDQGRPDDVLPKYEIEA